MSEQTDATITENEGVITVTFIRENKLNAINAQMTATLWEATHALAERDDLRCMVITGRGPYFTAGVDMATDVENGSGDPKTKHPHPGWNFRRSYRSHHLLYDEFETIEKPIILAAQGHCLGSGLEMAVSCDFRFCTPATEFALPEVHLGVVAGSGGMSRLTRLVGPSWGKWLAMAGQRIDSQRALQIGLVHEVFELDTFLEDVYAFCRDLISISAEPLGIAKLAVDMYADIHDRTVQRHIDRILMTGIMDSAEYSARTARFRPTTPAD